MTLQVNVQFPCFTQNDDYITDLLECLLYLNYVACEQMEFYRRIEVYIASDFKVECTRLRSSGYLKSLRRFMNDFNLNMITGIMVLLFIMKY